MSIEGLEALRTRFRERTIEDGAALKAWIAQACPPSPDSERLIHNLAGAAGTFGFAALHKAAAHVDDIFAGGGTPEVADIEGVMKEIDRLER